MKKLIFLVFVLCFFAKGWAAQSVADSNLKYGKPTDEELSMTVYAPDSSAVAVVLYKKTEAYYEFIANNFRINYAHEFRIKVLKSEGTSYADVTIPYYDNERNSSKEIISQVDASAYNLEDGKTVRTKMKKEFIFRERINNKYMQLKFSIPNVKVGTVLEYKYRNLSDFYYSLEDWDAQQNIPILYGQYDITIPEYFKFNLEVRGYERLESSETHESVSFTASNARSQQSDMVNCSGRHLCFKAHQLPALPIDGHVFCPNDYRSRVTFELRGLDFPGIPYKSFTSTWEQIDEMLLKESEFGDQLKIRNPYRDEIAALNINQLPDVQTKVCALFTFLQKKISWNEQYDIYGDARKAAKNGTGSNADINFLLMSMLRDANIPSYPVVMSRRDRGAIPFSHPSIQKINTFVVAIPDTDSTYVFIDGSVRHGYLNVLPPVLMVSRARLVREKESKWMDLSNIGKNQIRSLVTATIGADGKISGTRITGYIGQYASSLRKQFRAAKDSADFINQLELEENIKVSEMKLEQLKDFTPEVKEALTFEKQATVNDNLIYLNPLVFLHTSKNPYIQEARKLPVELPYIESITLSIALTLPEGYVLDELPKSLALTTEDKQGKCFYIPNQQENRLLLNYRFSFNKLLYVADEYLGLKVFWESLANKNNEMIVLKKL